MRLADMTSAQLAAYYDELERKNAMYYQETGASRYDTIANQYGRIADAFRAKASLEGERQIDIRKRMANMQGVIDRLIPGKQYSTAEVEKLLRAAVWW